MSLTSYRAAPPRVISVFGEAEDRDEETALAVFVDSANRRFVAYGLGRNARSGIHSEQIARGNLSPVREVETVSSAPGIQVPRYITEAKRPLEGGLLFGWAGVVSRRCCLVFSCH